MVFMRDSRPCNTLSERSTRPWTAPEEQQCVRPGACNVTEKDPAVRGGNPTKVQCCREGRKLIGKKKIKGQMLVRDVRH